MRASRREVERDPLWFRFRAPNKNGLLCQAGSWSDIREVRYEVARIALVIVRSSSFVFVPSAQCTAAGHPAASVMAGGAEEARTPDPLLAKEVLSQLSYGPRGRR